MSTYEREKIRKLEKVVKKQGNDLKELTGKFNWLEREVKSGLQDVIERVVRENVDITVEDKTVDEQLKDILSKS